MPTRTKDGRRLPGVGANWIRPARRLAIYRRDGWRCGYCGRGLRNHPHLRTLDHVVPRAQGGTHGDSNLLMACKKCNDRKQHHPWAPWRTPWGSHP